LSARLSLAVCKRGWSRVPFAAPFAVVGLIREQKQGLASVAWPLHWQRISAILRLAQTGLADIELVGGSKDQGHKIQTGVRSVLDCMGRCCCCVHRFIRRRRWYLPLVQRLCACDRCVSFHLTEEGRCVAYRSAPEFVYSHKLGARLHQRSNKGASRKDITNSK
jgi:hypothetical protein